MKGFFPGLVGVLLNCAFGSIVAHCTTKVKVTNWGNQVTKYQRISIVWFQVLARLCVIKYGTEYCKTLLFYGYLFIRFWLMNEFPSIYFYIFVNFRINCVKICKIKAFYSKLFHILKILKLLQYRILPNKRLCVKPPTILSYKETKQNNKLAALLHYIKCHLIWAMYVVFGITCSR
jgi:hypothetical protein